MSSLTPHTNTNLINTLISSEIYVASKRWATLNVAATPQPPTPQSRTFIGLLGQIGM